MLALLVTPAAVGAADDPWQFGSATSFSSGQYGTDARTEVLHTPISARRLFTDGDLTLVFPWTCVWGTGVVTIVNGAPVRNDRLAGAAATGTRGETTDGATNNAGTFHNCGVGDIVARGRYYVLDERAWMPTIALRAHVKVPTASAEQGLGTGRPDEGVGVEISHTITRDTLAMADGGYTVIGEPTRVDYNNNWWYDIGINQRIGSVANRLIDLSVFFEEYRAIVPGLANARDVLAAVGITGATGWRVQATGQFGLSEGAPDHGISFGVSRRF